MTRLKNACRMVRQRGAALAPLTVVKRPGPAPPLNGAVEAPGLWKVPSMLNHVRNVITASRTLSYVTHGIGVVTVGAVLALCAVNAHAQDNGTTHTEATFTEVFPDTCTGELVDLTFTQDTVFHVFTDTSGGFHEEFHMVVSGEGVGETTGTVYIVHETFEEHFNVAAGESLTVVITFSLISQGGASNIKVDELLHVTLNANGTVTVSFSDMDMTCT